MTEDRLPTYDETDLEALREALLGRTVVSATRYEDVSGVHPPDLGPYRRAEGELLLDDGTALLLAGNEGGCSCGAGDYALTLLKMPVNAIMDVQISTTELDSYGEEFLYQIFVLADDTRVEVARFEGCDGNGYYGTGFWFQVLPPTRPL